MQCSKNAACPLPVMSRLAGHIRWRFVRWNFESRRVRVIAPAASSTHKEMIEPD